MTLDITIFLAIVCFLDVTYSTATTMYYSNETTKIHSGSIILIKRWFIKDKLVQNSDIKRWTIKDKLAQNSDTKRWPIKDNQVRSSDNEKIEYQR